MYDTFIFSICGPVSGLELNKNIVGRIANSVTHLTFENNFNQNR